MISINSDLASIADPDPPTDNPGAVEMKMVDRIPALLKKPVLLSLALASLAACTMDPATIDAFYRIPTAQEYHRQILHQRLSPDATRGRRW